MTDPIHSLLCPEASSPLGHLRTRQDAEGPGGRGWAGLAVLAEMVSMLDSSHRSALITFL